MSETVEIRLVLREENLRRLVERPVSASALWLTEQPDGSYALGISGQDPRPHGVQPRTPETDNRDVMAPSSRKI